MGEPKEHLLGIPHIRNSNDICGGGVKLYAHSLVEYFFLNSYLAKQKG